MVFLLNLTGLGGILITDTLMTGYFIIPTKHMSERSCIAGYVWQYKTIDLLTVYMKNLQGITERNEKSLSNFGNRQFCKNLNKCSLKFYSVFVIPVQWIMTET